MNESEIKRTQRRVETDDDGFWGSLSTAACQDHLAGMMPARFPTQAQVSRGRSIYGAHGEKGGYSPPTKKITLPFPLHLYGNPDRLVRTLSPHEQCADSLLAVFERLAEAFPTEAAKRKAGILCYDGLYNPRTMRGGSSWSMHSWAIAIDLNAGENGNTTHWPTRASMPIEVMECFAKEGWLSAGAFWSRDAMHFQATHHTIQD